MTVGTECQLSLVGDDLCGILNHCPDGILFRLPAVDFGLWPFRLQTRENELEQQTATGSGAFAMRKGVDVAIMSPEEEAYIESELKRMADAAVANPAG